MPPDLAIDFDCLRATFRPVPSMLAAMVLAYAMRRHKPMRKLLISLGCGVCGYQPLVE